MFRLLNVLNIVLIIVIYVNIQECHAKVNSKVKCTEDVMRVEIATPLSYVKGIYLDGLQDYPNEQCRPKIDTEHELYVFDLSLKDVFQCGVTRMLNQRTGKRVYYHSIIVETTDKLVPKEIVYVKCVISSVPADFLFENSTHTVVKRNVLPAGFQEADDLETPTTVFKKAPEPTLGVNVRQGGIPLSGGQLHVAPGTPLQMEIFLDKTSAPIYGLLVTHMQVTDTGTQEETIIYNGCSIDPYLFDNFNTIDGDFLTAKFRAFKFPESTYVQFRGTVNVCLDKCRGVECSNGITGYGRRKREISSLPADPNKVFEITISSFIKVNFENETKSLDELIEKQLHKHKKFITGPEQDDKRGETDLSAKQVKNNGVSSSIEEIQYTAIVEESTSSASFNQFSIVLSLVFVFLIRFY